MPLKKVPIGVNHVEWNPSNADTIGTTAGCPEYRGVRISDTFLVGVAMRTRAVEYYEAARFLPCCTLATKANQRLVLCLRVRL